MKFTIGIFVLAFIGVIAWAVLVLIPISGKFQTLSPLLVDQCRHVDVAPGTEDIEIDELTGQVFISIFERRGWYLGDEETRPAGAIYLLDLDDSTLTPTLISEDAPDDFSPHGISLWRDTDGERRLFVVNHRADGTEAIEMFDINEDGSLFHTETVTFDAMYSPNDVVAVGNRTFYATNDKRYDGGALGMLEIYLGLALTDIVYFDGVTGSVAADGFVYANGINASADGSKIYVAEVLKRRISILERNIATGALEHINRIPLSTAPDNIDVAPDRSLYIAGHTRIFDFVDHAKDPAAVSPSHVVRVDPVTGESADVFISMNGEINGSSVGAANDSALIVGAVFDAHVMVCPLGS